LLEKRTTGLMQPQMKSAIEKATRKQFPQGIAAYGTDALRLCLARSPRKAGDLRFDIGKSRGVSKLLQQALECRSYVLMNVEDQDLKSQGSRIQSGRPVDPLAARGDADAHRSRVRRLSARQVWPNALYELPA